MLMAGEFLVGARYQTATTLVEGDISRSKPGI